jgi:hypothetical protein
MNDEIITYIRQSEEGVSSQEIATRFLKFTSPNAAMADAAVTGVLQSDQRCYKDEQGLWHCAAATAAADTRDRLSLSNLRPVSLRPIVQQGSRVATEVVVACADDVHATPQLVHRGLVRDHAPGASAAVDIPGILSVAEEVAFLEQVIDELGRYTGVYLSLFHFHYLQRQCAMRGLRCSDDAVYMDSLLSCASLTPRSAPLSLSHTLELVYNDATRLQGDPRQHGYLFTECVQEVVSRCATQGVETREALAGTMAAHAQVDLSGTSLTRQQLMALPTGPGVCALKDSNGRYLYITETDTLRDAAVSVLAHHAAPSSTGGLAAVQQQAHTLSWYACGCVLEALLYAHNAVAAYTPAYAICTPTLLEGIRPVYPDDDRVLMCPHADATQRVWIGVHKKGRVLMSRSTMEGIAACAARLYAFVSASALNEGADEGRTEGGGTAAGGTGEDEDTVEAAAGGGADGHGSRPVHTSSHTSRTPYIFGTSGTQTSGRASAKKGGAGAGTNPPHGFVPDAVAWQRLQWWVHRFPDTHTRIDMRDIDDAATLQERMAQSF